ncbi:DUF2993 domain-containing protein [Streptomyces phaeoluteigriseus]|uniref:DUF2993 domain-containing protein n=1 Tax=Streptomyces phaeoluteigriseus TaxID=114686 RepID=A0ABY4ZA35_9ACTN|nr:DUF2993 domain-containing protein [Streptomyces phaeoluteigriseus]USQ85385.1 DUF2993 domain-containing protein [Streptomyces phaeoluteigriseus]
MLAGAVVVDRVAAARAEKRAAEAFQEGMATPRRPSVHVSGFPVLTQLAGGRLRHVDITAADIPAHGTTRPLPVTRLTVGLDGLKTSGSADEAHARSAEATAFLSYEDVSGEAHSAWTSPRRAGPGRRDGQPAARRRGEREYGRLGRRRQPDRLHGCPRHPGRAVPSREGSARQGTGRARALHNIPEGLHLRSITTTANGIKALFTGTSVTFHPNQTSGWVLGVFGTTSAVGRFGSPLRGDALDDHDHRLRKVRG